MAIYARCDARRASPSPSFQLVRATPQVVTASSMVGWWSGMSDRPLPGVSTVMTRHPRLASSFARRPTGSRHRRLVAAAPAHLVPRPDVAVMQLAERRLPLPPFGRCLPVVDGGAAAGAVGGERRQRETCYGERTSGRMPRIDLRWSCDAHWGREGARLPRHEPGFANRSAGSHLRRPAPPTSTGIVDRMRAPRDRARRANAYRCLRRAAPRQLRAGDPYCLERACPDRQGPASTSTAAEPSAARRPAASRNRRAWSLTGCSPPMPAPPARRSAGSCRPSAIPRGSPVRWRRSAPRWRARDAADQAQPALHQADDLGQRVSTSARPACRRSPALPTLSGIGALMSRAAAALRPAGLPSGHGEARPARRRAPPRPRRSGASRLIWNAISSMMPMMSPDLAAPRALISSRRRHRAPRCRPARPVRTRDSRSWLASCVLRALPRTAGHLVHRRGGLLGGSPTVPGAPLRSSLPRAISCALLDWTACRRPPGSPPPAIAAHRRASSAR